MWSCPTYLDGYGYAENRVWFEDPLFIDVNTDLVIAEWAFIDHTCMQSAVRRYVLEWFGATGWAPTLHGWTSSFGLTEHYAWIENFANFANQAFCDPFLVTGSHYPHVRILTFDDGSASFFDDAYAEGDCWYLLHHDSDHYTAPY
jgi:hypothetical protein